VQLPNRNRVRLGQGVSGAVDGEKTIAVESNDDLLAAGMGGQQSVDRGKDHRGGRDVLHKLREIVAGEKDLKLVHAWPSLAKVIISGRGFGCATH